MTSITINFKNNTITEKNPTICGVFDSQRITNKRGNLVEKFKILINP